MIAIDKCEIDIEGKTLTIEAHVEELSYFENVYIDSITIDTDKTYSPTGPSSTAIYTQTFSVEPSNTIGSLTTMLEINSGMSEEESNKGVKKIKLCLTSVDLQLSSLNDNIFFVYLKSKGTPAADTPCNMDNEYTMGVAINLRPIYNLAMQYIKELNLNCTTPKGFIDIILRLKAFDLSLKTGNYMVAIDQWSTFFKNKISVTMKQNCGCSWK